MSITYYFCQRKPLSRHHMPIVPLIRRFLVTFIPRTSPIPDNGLMTFFSLSLFMPEAPPSLLPPSYFLCYNSQHFHLDFETFSSIFKPTDTLLLKNNTYFTYIIQKKHQCIFYERLLFQHLDTNSHGQIALLYA